MDAKPQPRLDAVLAPFRGLHCWSIIAGAGTGSVVSLGFGRKVPRTKILTNPHLSEEQRHFDAEYSIFVECAWRLDARDQVVCGCWDSNDADGPMIRGLQRLRGEAVQAIDVSVPAFDLTVKYGSGLVLHVFCDQLLQGASDNYSIFTLTDVFVIGPRSHLRIEPRRRE